MFERDKGFQTLERAAILGAEAICEFLTYQGSNRDYLVKARVGAVAGSNYTRVRATMANEEAIKLMASRHATRAFELPVTTEDK